MNIRQEGFIAGFIVLVFVIFIAGFMMGMLAIAFIPIKSDVSILMLMSFAFGFMLGMITVALMFVITKLRELTRKQS